MTLETSGGLKRVAQEGRRNQAQIRTQTDDRGQYGQRDQTSMAGVDALPMVWSPASVRAHRASRTPSTPLDPPRPPAPGRRRASRRGQRRPGPRPSRRSSRLARRVIWSSGAATLGARAVQQRPPQALTWRRQRQRPASHHLNYLTARAARPAAGGGGFYSSSSSAGVAGSRRGRSRPARLGGGEGVAAVDVEDQPSARSRSQSNPETAERRRHGSSRRGAGGCHQGSRGSWGGARPVRAGEQD